MVESKRTKFFVQKAETGSTMRTTKDVVIKYGCDRRSACLYVTLLINQRMLRWSQAAPILFPSSSAIPNHVWHLTIAWRPVRISTTHVPRISTPTRSAVSLLVQPMTNHHSSKSSSSCSWMVRRVFCSLILKMKLVPPSLPWSYYVPSSFWFIQYCSACFASLFVSILCTCCSHFFWYCFISKSSLLFIHPKFTPYSILPSPYMPEGTGGLRRATVWPIPGRRFHSVAISSQKQLFNVFPLYDQFHIAVFMWNRDKLDMPYSCIVFSGLLPPRFARGRLISFLAKTRELLDYFASRHASLAAKGFL